MHSIIGLVEFLIGAVVALMALALILLVVVSRMPPDNPLRQVLNLLIARIGATAAAGALAIPIEPIPGLDLLYDIGAPVFLLYYLVSVLQNHRAYLVAVTGKAAVAPIAAAGESCIPPEAAGGYQRLVTGPQGCSQLRSRHAPARHLCSACRADFSVARADQPGERHQSWADPHLRRHSRAEA